jgi:hypothetical protein
LLPLGLCCQRKPAFRTARPFRRRMERAFRRRMERNGSLSGTQSSREKPARARSVPLVLPELMERVGVL